MMITMLSEKGFIWINKSETSPYLLLFFTHSTRTICSKREKENKHISVLRSCRM